MDEAVRMHGGLRRGRRDGRLVELLLGEIGRMPEVLHVPIPLDPSSRICEAVIADTSSDLTLDDWVDRSGAAGAR